MLPKIEKDPKYRSEREEKIKVYKASRVAEDEMTALHAKMMQGSKNYREYTKALLSFKCYQAVSDLEILPQEMEMLEFKKKLGQDSEFRRQYEAEQKKPAPKPFFQKIDSREKDPKVTQIHTSDLKPHSCGHHHVLGTPCPTKMDILDTLWQPDHAQPKMTMDQHADLEIYMMEKKQKREMEHQKQEDAKMAKLNEEDKDELQTYKDRMWDDWKDENEKGAGNKKR
jgi:immunoglobulin-binding protein 1